jgi:hypothetical protein
LAEVFSDWLTKAASPLSNEVPQTTLLAEDVVVLQTTLKPRSFEVPETTDGPLG